jgi:hypothetical protein
VLGSSFAFVTAIAAACDDDPGDFATPPDSGGPLGALGDSVCPDVAPDAGAGCVLPEGTTCAFGACGALFARCSFGIWRYSGNPTSRPPCPQDFPASDSLCPPCWPQGAECVYGSSDCSAPDASANTTVASCVLGADQQERWSLRSSPCAISDAGADVQRDAEPDAD